MTARTLPRLLLLVTLAALPLALHGCGSGEGKAEPGGLWTDADPGSAPSGTGRAFLRAEVYKSVALDVDALLEKLRQAPLEVIGGPREGVTIEIPNPDGDVESFEVCESPVLSPELQADHPDERTYLGWGLTDKTASLRCSWTTLGFQAQVFSVDKGAWYVDPMWFGDTTVYSSYYKSDFQPEEDAIFHPPIDDDLDRALRVEAARAVTLGGTLREFRLAISTTGEYNQFFGGNGPAFSVILATINRVTQVMENDISVRLRWTCIVQYGDPTTDPYPDGIAGTGGALPLVQADLDATCGSGSYDVGHLLGQGGSGGIAGVGVVCVAGAKAQGTTSRMNPQGDPFDIDFVAHEIGHQFGATHTFNDDGTGSCAGNRSAGTAVEPGSGSTIMAYAGICGASNLQANSDPYWHCVSIDQVDAYVGVGGGTACVNNIPTGNNVPTANAGPDFSMPQGTPFSLTGQGADFDAGDVLTYCWEQRDLGPAQTLAMADNGLSPLFRSLLPVTTPTRVFPRYADLLAGNVYPGTLTGEQLPSTDRTLTFSLTVRDNRAGGGGVATDTMQVTVSGAPLVVTFPNGGENVPTSVPQNVTWDVGGSAAHAANVDILLSTDGGLTFPTVLVAGTPNDGTEAVVFDCADIGTNLRIQVRSATSPHYFFDISNGDFELSDQTPPVFMNCPADITVECANAAGMGTQVFWVEPTLTDNCPGVMLTQTHMPGDFFPDPLGACPVGATLVTYTATDVSGNMATCSFTVTVQDTTPPVVTAAAQRPYLFLPRNGMIDVLLAKTVTDTCDPNAGNVMVEVWSNQNLTTAPYEPDAAVVGTTLQARAEVDLTSPLPGRAYLFILTATDCSGRVGRACAWAIVPKTLTALDVLGARTIATNAQATCAATGLPPAGWFQVLAPTPLP